MMDYASMLMESDAEEPDGLGSEFWLAPNLPFALRGRIETVFEVLGHLPLEQPLAVVADAGKTVAVNAPLLRLLGHSAPEVVGQMWSRVMPAWPERARSFRRAGEQVFEEHLAGSGGDSVWVRVSLGPLAERGEQRAMAYVLFISRPDVETVDHEEVRRLRKSLQLLADTQTDYVVEVDREAMMTFVSPSFCRALGASEAELIGKPFAGRVLAADQAGVAAAIGQALRPPFAAEMQARLAAVPGETVSWQIDAVIGDGVVGLDIVGRLERAGQEAPPTPGATPVATALHDLRLAPIARALEALESGDQAGLEALARAVGEAAGAECVSYSVRRGDAVEKALGWRLPSA
jgi:PAS domain S-box-containing protein